MIIVVEGTKSFDDYNLFMRGMTVAFATPNYNDEIQVWSLGPYKINNFTAAFCNSSSDYMKGKGIKTRFSKVSYEWVKKNIEYADYFAFFSEPKEPLSRFATWADHQEGLEVGIFRY